MVRVLLVLGVLLALGAGWLWYRESRSLEACLQGKWEDPVTCYTSALVPFIEKGEYQRAASLCLKEADPACYRAFGSLVPDRSLCSLLERGGRAALYLCSGW